MRKSYFKDSGDFDDQFPTLQNPQRTFPTLMIIILVELTTFQTLKPFLGLQIRLQFRKKIDKETTKKESL